jgi:hypothetical protein
MVRILLLTAHLGGRHSRERIEVMVDGSSKPIRRFCRDIPAGTSLRATAWHFVR